ncbi:hypothetical protein TWF281_000799 [Arthrobotrys megalospora]
MESPAIFTNGDSPSWLRPLEKPLKPSVNRESSSKQHRRSPMDPNEPNPVSKAEVGDEMSKADIIPSQLGYIENSVISKPPDVSLNDMDGFNYIERGAGSGVVAYIVDTGLDFSHKYFDRYRNQLTSKSSLNWVYAGPLPDDERSDYGRPFKGFGADEPSYKDPVYYGTMDASKIHGETGIAPWTELVVVKSPTGRGTITAISELDCFLKIYDHLMLLRGLDKDKELNFRGAVITTRHLELSTPAPNSPRLKFYEARGKLLIEILVYLEAQNAYSFFPIFQHPSGVTSLPAKHILDAQKEHPNFLKKTAVIGAIRTSTGESLHLVHPGVKLYAPATDISMPGLYGNNPDDPDQPPDIKGSGAGFPTALTAGVCAAMISRGWEDPLKRMEELAYKRTPNGPNVIWNGINKATWSKARKKYGFPPIQSTPFVGGGNGNNGDGNGKGKGKGKGKV